MDLNVSSNNKRIAKNTIALTLRMFFTMAIGIYSSRILLAHLGVTDYGVNNVVAGIITMFTFLNASLVNATQRYLNFYLGKNDFKTLNNVFSTSINIFVLLAVLITICAETIGVYFLNYRLDIPADRLTAANWVLQFTIISTFITIVSTPYNALIIAEEKMATFAYVAVANSVYLLFAAFVIPYIPFDHLIGYSAIVLVWHIGVRLFYSWYCSSRFVEIRYRWVFDKSLFKDMFAFSGWTLIHTFTYMTYTQGLTFLINMFFGPVVNAAQALAQQVNGSLSTFSANFMMAAKPQITKYYAEGNINQMRDLVFFSSKMSYAIMSIVSLPFIIRTDYVLGLWLKEVPNHTSSFLQLYLVIAIINTLAHPAIAAIHATGNIKCFHIFESVILILILPFSYFSILIWKIPEICYLIMLTLVILVQLVRVYYMKQQVGISLIEYAKDIIMRMFVCISVSYLSAFYINRIIPITFIGFCLEGIVCLLCFMTTFYAIGLTSKERSLIVAFLRKKVCYAER